ncbi:DUF1320 family protein [candidate division WOR-3 bacterium]|nr:DUF1320 family protein [candidate division WOR-3 bacterium]
MAYSTDEEIRMAWNEIAETELPLATITKAIQKADGDIDAFLDCKYVTPFSPVPQIINGISLDIALFYCKLWKDPRMVVDEDGKLEMNYKIALGKLEAINKGKMNVPGVSQRQLCSSTREDHTPVFGEDGLLNAKLDKDLEDEIEDSRD